MYIQLETMKEVTECEIRSLYQNTSFPTPFVAPDGFAVVFPTPSPTVTELQVAVRDGVEVDSKGNYVEKWLVKDMFSDYTTEDGVLITKLEQETKYLADKAKALVPISITPRQARLKLLEADLLDNLEAVITTNRAWQIEWEYATEVKRDSLLIDAIATQAGLTSEQVDTLFIEAAKL
jgi:hypothetical protein